MTLRTLNVLLLLFPLLLGHAQAEDAPQNTDEDRESTSQPDGDTPSDSSQRSAEGDDGVVEAGKATLDKSRLRLSQRQNDALKPAKAKATQKSSSASAKKAKSKNKEGSSGSQGSSGSSGIKDATGTGGAAVRRSLPAIPEDVRFTIDYNEADLKDVIKDFAEKLPRNFLVDPKVSGKITIISPTPVSKDEAYRAFLAALDAAGYALVDQVYNEKGEPILTRIMPSKNAIKEPLRLYKHSTPRNPALITRLIQLENIGADEVSKVIQKWVSSAGELITYAPSNMLILTDSANNIRRILELIKELDISAPRQKLEVIPIEFAEAPRILEIVKEIYGQEGKSTGSSKKKRAKSKKKKKGKKGASSAAATSVGTSFIGKMIADDRTNSIIVLATEKSLEEIKDLIARLDYETDPFAQSDIHVIYLEHAKSEELSQTLNSLTQQSNQRATQKKKNKKKNKAKAAGGAPGNLGGNFQDEVRITHDASTNSLVVTASADDYRRLKKVIDLLDIPRKQVFVETVIMEVSDSIRRDTGASWHGGVPGEGEAGISVIGARGSQSVNLASALLDGSLLGGLALGVFGSAINVPLPGIDGGLEIPGFGLVLRALQEDSSTNVLSAPNILTLDNEEAQIEIGETVPFPTGGLLGSLAGAATGATGGFGLPSVSFSREDVGIILRITPQINESNWVTLDIYQEISEVKEGSAADTLASGGPTTTKRSAETHVSVQSNQTIVIGGLMQEVETESETKVPILGDIPLLGFLFRSKAKTKRKTNLLIFLTPHVIDGPEDLQEVYRVKMLQRQEFMRRFYGKTPQQQAEELNKLIRFSMNLPGQPSVYRDQEHTRKDGSVTDDVLNRDVALKEALEQVTVEEDQTLITSEGEEIQLQPEDMELEDGGEESSDPNSTEEAVEDDGADPDEGSEAEEAEEEE